MARRSGDLMRLLAQRGSARRERSGFLGALAGKLRGAFVGRTAAHGQKPRGLPGAGLAILGLVTLGTGYLAGNAFPWRKVTDDLRIPGPAIPARREPVAPAALGEEPVKPLASRCLLAAAYRDRSVAMAAARNLREQGVGSARALEFSADESGPLWGVVVYFETEADQRTATKALQQVKAPDDTFDSFRKTQKDWPLVRSFR